MCVKNVASEKYTEDYYGKDCKFLQAKDWQ